MAIAYGDATAGFTTGDGSPSPDNSNLPVAFITLTAPVVTGSNTLMLCAYSIDANGENVPSNGVTYNSVDITANLIGTVRVNYTRVGVYYVINPTSAATFRVNWSGDGPQCLALACAYFTGVDQTTPVRTATTNTGLANPATADVTNSATGDLIAQFFGINDTTTANALTLGRVGAGQTFRLTQPQSVDSVHIAMSTEPGASGTVTGSWDFVDNVDNGFATVQVPLIAATSGPAPTPVLRGVTRSGLRPG